MPDRRLAEGNLQAARVLLQASRNRPTQTLLRRSLSCCYYALFHALARACANALVGAGQNSPRKAWVEVYRGLEHGPAKDACGRIGAAKVNFPPELISVADAFRQLQQLRNVSDYDPLFRTTKAEVADQIQLAESAINALTQVDPIDRKAFAAWILIRSTGAADARNRRGKRGIA